MSRQSTDTAVSSQRLLASAIGVAITAIAAPQAAHADEAGQKKTDKDRVLSLDAATIVGEQQDETTYNVDRSASKKYTAPLLDTPRSVTVVPKQVIKDTAAVSLQDALRTVPGITFGAGEGGNPTGDRPFIRGFDAQSDTYVDGVRPRLGTSSMEASPMVLTRLAGTPWTSTRNSSMAMRHSG